MYRVDIRRRQRSRQHTRTLGSRYIPVTVFLRNDIGTTDVRIDSLSYKQYVKRWTDADVQVYDNMTRIAGTLPGTYHA